MNNEREEFVQETIEGMAPPYLLETCLTKSKNLNTLSHLHGSDVKPENDLNYPVKIEEDDFLYEADEDKQYDCPVKAEHLKTPCAQPTKGSSRQNDLNYPVKIEEDDFLYEADEDKQYVYVQEDCPVKAEHLKTPCAQPTKGSSRQFNMEEKLIEAVRVRKVLYDTSHKDYLKTKLKAEKWEEVAKETDIRSGAEAKMMWEKLRHSLRDALRRQQKCMKSGAPAEFVKRWKFQKQMGFLQPYMVNKSREGNLNEDIDDSETSSQNCDIDSPTDVVEECEESLSMQQGIRKSQNEAQSQALPEISPPTQGPTSVKKMKKDTISVLLKRSMEQREERRKSRSEERKRMVEQMSAPSDSLYHFFISMYEVTKTMPPSSQFVVRNDVFRVVTEMEATLLNIPA